VYRAVRQAEISNIEAAGLFGLGSWPPTCIVVA
jgi:hypothetical protein